MNDYDIFDILGISEREDSYTDLFVYAFKSSAEYRKRVNAVLDGFFADPETIQIKSGEVFQLSSIPLIGGRKVVAPDILMYSAEEAKLLIIESKLFSGEDATTDIASDAAEKVYKERYSYSDARFWFVTVDGRDVGSTVFKALRVADLICGAGVTDEMGQPLFADENLRVPMNALFQRASTYKEFADLSLGDAATFSNLLESKSQWIDTGLVFRRYFTSVLGGIAPELGLNMKFSGGKDEQYICTLGDPEWVAGDLTDKTLSAEEKRKTHNIHMEINWVEGDRLSVYMHYEMNPRTGKKDSLSYSNDILTSFQTKRSHFTGNAAKEIRKSTYWKPLSKLHVFAVSADGFEGWEDRPLSEIRALMYSVINEGAAIIRKTLANESASEGKELNILM